MEIEDKLIIKPTQNYELIANDGSSFSSEYFANIKNKLINFKSIHSSEDVEIYPNNYEEDYVQVYRRTSFNLSDWNIVLLTLDDDENISSVLLTLKSNLKEGFVLDLTTNLVKSIFYRGFKVQESIDLPLVDDDLFLESLGFTEQKVETELYFSYVDNPEFDEEDEDVPTSISIDLPVFEAHSKKKIVNLGSTVKIEEEEISEDEDVEIEVVKPTFVSNKKGKIPNLGYSGQQRFKKEKVQPTHIDIEKPVFEANSNKKVANLGSSTTKKPINSKPKVKPIIKVKPLVISEPELPKFEANSKAKIVNFDQQIKEENKNWRVIDIYKIKPHVFDGEQSILNNSSFKSFDDKLSKVLDILKGKNGLYINDECTFSPKAIGTDEKPFKLIKSFKYDDYFYPVLVCDKNDEIIQVCAVNKDDNNICFVLGKDFSVTAITINGLCLDDRALPFLTFEQLLKMTGIK